MYCRVDEEMLRDILERVGTVSKKKTTIQVRWDRCWYFLSIYRGVIAVLRSILRQYSPQWQYSFGEWFIPMAILLYDLWLSLFSVYTLYSLVRLSYSTWDQPQQHISLSDLITRARYYCRLPFAVSLSFNPC